MLIDTDFNLDDAWPCGRGYTFADDDAVAHFSGDVYGTGAGVPQQQGGVGAHQEGGLALCQTEILPISAAISNRAIQLILLSSVEPFQFAAE